MKKTYIVLIIFVLAILYLWFAYARIYNTIGAGNLTSPDIIYTYGINSTKVTADKITYGAIGDSLTAGVGVMSYDKSYPYVLAQKMAASTNVILKDFAYPGARTENVIKDILPNVIAAQPNVVTLLIGVNDIHGQVAEETFKANYSYILNELATKTKAKVYLVSIPYLGANNLLWFPYNYYFNFKTDKYNEVIQSLAFIFEMKYVDITTPTADMARDPYYYAADLFHPTAVSYQRWANIIYDSINK